VWVPVGIEDDDSVGGLQVESKATSTCAQDEEKDLWMWIVEHRQQLATIIALRCPIKTQVLVSWQDNRYIFRNENTVNPGA